MDKAKELNNPKIPCILGFSIAHTETQVHVI